MPITERIVAEFEFLSTLSLRRATENSGVTLHDLIISIHALLAESDITLRSRLKRVIISIHALLAESDSPEMHDVRWFFYFYPRSPCGERHMCFSGKTRIPLFLSTLSLRRATRVHIAI